MFNSFHNLVVNIMAAFIKDRNKRHEFRNKYIERTKFRRLRDDNNVIMTKLNSLIGEIASLKNDINRIKRSSLAYSTLKPLDGEFEDYVSVACTVKNEGPYLKEWIEYHKIIGIDRFYIYDNDSTDDTKNVLEPYIKDGSVIYKFTRGRVMIPSYQDAILKAQTRSRWLALIDLDEFLVPNEKDNIKDFLKEFEAYPGVGINWVIFDSNGHETKPEAGGG